MESGSPTPAPVSGQPFSMHARGVTTYDSSQYCDLSYQFRRCLQELRDISSSLLVLIYLQTWQAMFVIVITIGSVSFYTYVGTAGSRASLNWTLISFVVLLPQILLLFLAYQRREVAYRELAKVKTVVLQLYWSFEGTGSYEGAVRDLLLSFTNVLGSYLNASRFYTREYPLTDITQKMTVVAQSRAKQARQLLLIFWNLSKCPENTNIGKKQLEWVAELQATYEYLAIIKEYRLPQSLRVLVRFYVVLIIPIFYGPYYAQIANSTGSFVFVLAFSVMMHLGMVVLMNAAIALEDPFTTDGVDGVFYDEAVYEVQQVLKGWAGEGMNGEAGDRNWRRHQGMQQAVPPPINSMTERARPDQCVVDMVSHQPLPRGESPPGD